MTAKPVRLIIPFAVTCLGIALFSAMDGFMKQLSIDLGAYNAMLWRTMTGAILGGSLFALRREALPKRETMRLHLVRGTISAFMATTFFWGIARVPLAEGMALSFIAPLITLYLAAVLLGEKIQPRAIIASLLGLAGVGVILASRLGSADYDEQVLWGIGSIFVSAVLYAYNLILQRQQAQVATPVEVGFFQSLIACSVLALASPFLAAVPGPSHWPYIIISAVLAFTSLVLISWAYARAEAQMLVTAEYTAFIWAALLGWIMFREPVSGATISGAILIVAGCIIATRQKPEHIEATAT
jgi:drug/metabolite transporter (DMT)-like permease